MHSPTLRDPRTAHRLVHSSTRLTIGVLITTLGCTGILLAQRGLFALCEARFEAAWGPAAIGAGMVAAALVLARYRNDLVDD